MQYETLFEITSKRFEWWPTLAAIAFAAVLFLIGRFSRGKANADRRIAGYCLAALALLFAMITFILMRSEFDAMRREYASGNYEVVEGPVENFRPMPREGGAYQPAHACGSLREGLAVREFSTGPFLLVIGTGIYKSICARYHAA
jgi:hypothetical protein